MSKIHIHSEQFDGKAHAWCGRGSTAVPSDRFEATPPANRCKLCDREWFPTGQPSWHLKQAQERRAKTDHVTAFYNDRANGAHAAKAP